MSHSTFSLTATTSISTLILSALLLLSPIPPATQADDEPQAANPPVARPLPAVIPPIKEHPNDNPTPAPAQIYRACLKRIANDDLIEDYQLSVKELMQFWASQAIEYAKVAGQHEHGQHDHNHRDTLSPQARRNLRALERIVADDGHGEWVQVTSIRFRELAREVLGRDWRGK